MHSIKKFILDIGWVFLSQIIILIIGFAITIILGRVLGANNLGLYSIALSLFNILILIAGIGIPNALTKYVAEYQDNKEMINILASCALINAILFGGITCIFLIFFSNAIAIILQMPELSILLIIMSLSIPIFLININLLSILNGLREMRIYSIRQIIRSISLILIISFFIQLGWGIRGAILATFFSEIIILILMINFTKGLFQFVIRDFIDNTKKFVTFGGQIFLTSAIWTTILYSDTLIVGFFLSAKDVGIYAIASLVAKTGFLALPSSISTVTYPMIASLHQKNLHRSIEQLINNSIKFCLVILSVLGFFIILVIKPIIEIALSEEFFPAIEPLSILLIGATLFGAIASVGGATVAMNRPDISYKLNLLIGIIYITADIFLIPRYGLIGAALGTSIAFALFPIFSFFFMKRIFNIIIDVVPFIVIFFSLSFLMAIFYLLHDMKYSSLLMGGIFFIYIVYLFFYFLTEEDKSLLKEIYKKFL